MRTKSVRRYAVPQYPTHDYLLEHPELLRWIPKRWRHNHIVLAALGMTVPLILARPAVAVEETKDTNTTTLQVAPLFPHGDGRGSFGCMAMNPPVFLSEDEARQVISDEAKKAGIEFVADGLTVKDASVPVTNPFDFLEKEKEKETASAPKKGQQKSPKLQKQDLVLDGYDKKRGIAFEFVSKKDFNKWEKLGNVHCTVSRYDMKGTAENLRQGLAKAEGNTVVGVFYEPAARRSITIKTEYPKKDATEAERKKFWEERKKAAKAMGEKELRQQVRDFIAWLKAEGVI